MAFYENLSSGEFNYCLYDEEKHSKMFEELNRDVSYVTFFYDIQEAAKQYKALCEVFQDEVDFFNNTIATLIVEREDTPVAVIELEIHETTVIMSSVVRPKYRNMGIKKCIVLDMCEYFYDHGIERLEFIVNKNNAANIKSLQGINAKLEEDKNEEVEKLTDGLYNRIYTLCPSNVMYKKNTL